LVFGGKVPFRRKTNPNKQWGKFPWEKKPKTTFQSVRKVKDHLGKPFFKRNYPFFREGGLLKGLGFTNFKKPVHHFIGKRFSLKGIWNGGTFPPKILIPGPMGNPVGKPRR